MEGDDGPTAKRALKKGLLERLAEGVVVGDGGMIWTMETRGYAKAGKYTPEVVVENGDAVLQAHREFVHNGAEVVQACTFWAARQEEEETEGKSINGCACTYALQAAKEANDSVLVAGGVTKTTAYADCASKGEVQLEFQRQLDFYIRNDFDFVVAEYFDRVEEAVWAVEVLKCCGKPVMATLCIGPRGDLSGVSPEECAVRLAQAGADLVGVNCRFGYITCLQVIAKMKQGLEAAHLDNVFLAVQPFGYLTPDAPITGYISMAEYPFGLDARTMTRIDAHKYALEAYRLGVRYIGGCCGFEPRHIRAMSEALQDVRGRIAPVTERYGNWIDSFRGKETTKADPGYWLQMEPATGRPRSSAVSEPVHTEEAAYILNRGYLRGSASSG